MLLKISFYQSATLMGFVFFTLYLDACYLCFSKFKISHILISSGNHLFKCKNTCS